MPELWRLADLTAGELDRVRLMWIQGRATAGDGQNREKSLLLMQVQEEFKARGMLYDFALVTLDLAVDQLEQGCSSTAKKLTLDMAPVFECREVHREALAALTLFRQAADQERATVDLVQRVARYLHRARHNPELRFADVHPRQ